ncbi:MAG: endolytic transglycosylase MltG [Alphaproteobacteria bacterium]|nr:endolytic transglycosylase MltG [Alphaproteobacteria bacterium]MBV8549033.1 endolytic transglycosylase MltG [Alphaproteobacteria bacterium]
MLPLEPHQPNPPQSAKHPARSGILSGIAKRVCYLIMAGSALVPASIFAGLVMPGPAVDPVTVVIPHGTSTRGMGDLLAAHGAVRSSLLFHIGAKLMAAHVLKEGEYQITPHESIADIVLMIHEGRSVVHRFTVAEGLTVAEVVHNLNDIPILEGGVGPLPDEGSLMPETYRYNYGDTRASVIVRMRKGMTDMLADLWTHRDANLPLTTPQEALVLASIVEKETGKAAERPRIAGVFYNRLRQHMRLQSDPTVIYAITKGRQVMDHALSHDDLSFPSPINTYASDGLPPQPICNPGRAAIEAVLHPETHDYLYFVADGTGGHAFASTLDEHNRNVAHWNDINNK